MNHTITIEIPMDQIEAAVDRAVRKALGHSSDVLLTAKEARRLMGINNHRTFQRAMEAYGIHGQVIGKTPRYSYNAIREVCK